MIFIKMFSSKSNNNRITTTTRIVDVVVAILHAFSFHSLQWIIERTRSSLWSYFSIFMFCPVWIICQLFYSHIIFVFPVFVNLENVNFVHSIFSCTRMSQKISYLLFMHQYQFWSHLIEYRTCNIRFNIYFKSQYHWY